MAIQISTTTVIDNSRNLTNIANATNANTASAFVQRDASGNFSAGTITASLSGTASNVTTNANLTGDVTSSGNTTSIAANVIVNNDINSSANIADTKLATISTAGKVSNSATTATSANTASAIVSRNGSGDFAGNTLILNGKLGVGVDPPQGFIESRKPGSSTVPNLVLQSGGPGDASSVNPSIQFSASTLESPGTTKILSSGPYGARSLSFHTGSDAAGSERVRIDSTGRLIVGTIASPANALQVSSDSAGKPSTNTWTTVSDERTKEEIELADLDLCYEAVKNIPLKRFKWKDEVYNEEQVRDRRKLGWIAQDVEVVFPKAVGINSEFKYNQVFEKIIIPATEEVLDDKGYVTTPARPERIENGELISENVIEDCRDLNSDQIYAAMYGAIQRLMVKVEILEVEVSLLKRA